MEPYYPLHVLVCDECFLVQLQEYVSPEHIFSEYAYFSSYSTSWVEHARSLLPHDQGAAAARAATASSSSSPATTATCCSTSCRWACRCSASSRPPTSPRSRVGAGVPTLVEFFGTALAERLVAEGKRADLIIGNNVLAQVPDLNDFVAGMKLLLAPEGVITLEFPHLQRLIAENQFDTIYHEHFSYFSLVTIDRLAESHGLKIIDVEELDDARRLAARLSGARRLRAPARRRASASCSSTRSRAASSRSRPTRALPSRCAAPSATCCPS